MSVAAARRPVGRPPIEGARKTTVRLRDDQRARIDELNVKLADFVRDAVDAALAR